MKPCEFLWRVGSLEKFGENFSEEWEIKRKSRENWKEFLWRVGSLEKFLWRISLESWKSIERISLDEMILK